MLNLTSGPVPSMSLVVARFDLRSVSGLAGQLHGPDVAANRLVDTTERRLEPQFSHDIYPFLSPWDFPQDSWGARCTLVRTRLRENACVLSREAYNCWRGVQQTGTYRKVRNRRR